MHEWAQQAHASTVTEWAPSVYSSVYTVETHHSRQQSTNNQQTSNAETASSRMYTVFRNVTLPDIIKKACLVVRAHWGVLRQAGRSPPGGRAGVRGRRRSSGLRELRIVIAVRVVATAAADTTAAHRTVTHAAAAVRAHTHRGRDNLVLAVALVRRMTAGAAAHLRLVV